MILFNNLVFGYWHGVSLASSLGFSFIGTWMLHYYSRRMVNDIYMLKDGKHIEVTYMNAFWVIESFNTVDALNLEIEDTESRVLIIEQVV